MTNCIPRIPVPENEPGLAYLPGSAEKAALKAEIARQYETTVEVPCIIGGKEVYTGNTIDIIMPDEKKHVLGKCHLAGAAELTAAKEAAMKAHKTWEQMPFAQRSAIFMRAARLLTTTHHDRLCAASILNQAKNIVQTEGDAGSGLSDFIRYNVYNASKIYGMQPRSDASAVNRIAWRPLEGFVAAITPFNYVSDASNLAIAPAVAGNTVIWKPSSISVLTNYYVMRALMDAGLPAGVINFVPAKGRDVTEYIVKDRDLAGIHFIGSTATFRGLWKTVGENIASYKNFPRLVGETGGKNFMLACPDADIEGLVTALVRGAFELSGQKCSATSRAYIPKSIWGAVKKRLLEEIGKIKVGPATDFSSFVPAVIDQNAFNSIKGYIDDAAASPDAEILCGRYDDQTGFFVWPTVIECKKPDCKTMVEEIFGPVLSVYVYEDEALLQTIRLVDTSTDYALTGALFTNNRETVELVERELNYACGNLYLNDKSTGAVPGYVPFGGGRASGTNDKAGSLINMLRWVTPRTVKEPCAPIRDWTYPCMDEE